MGQYTVGLPERYVTSIQASPTFPDHVYVCQSGYKDNDWQSHLFISKERGEKWKAIRGDLPYISINDLIIIPEQKDSILFVATDAGVYGSLNAGKNWYKLGANLPLIAVYDLEYVPEKMELIAGTFGRSIHTYNIKSILEKEYTLTVSPASLQFPSTGGNYSLNIFSNTSWTVFKNQHFFNFSSTSGTNNSVVKVICEPNNTLSPRSGSIVIKGIGIDSVIIKVIQERFIPVFSISPQYLNFLQSGGIQSLSISTNTTWSLYESLDYISTSISNVNGNKLIDVKCTSNDTPNKREGVLKFLPNGMDTIFVKISQQGSIPSEISNKSRLTKVFKIFPIPITSDFIYLKRVNYSFFQEGINALLYNQTGHLIKSYQIPIYENAMTLNLSNLVNGTYFLVFRNEANQIIQTEKLIK